MDEAKLEESLQRIGKANFVDYFEQLSDFTLTNRAVAEHIVTDSACTYKSALGQRVEHGRRIIRAGQARDAMLLISRSTRLDPPVVHRAAEIAKSLEKAGDP